MSSQALLRQVLTDALAVERRGFGPARWAEDEWGAIEGAVWQYVKQSVTSASAAVTAKSRKRPVAATAGTAMPTDTPVVAAAKPSAAKKKKTTPTLAPAKVVAVAVNVAPGMAGQASAAGPTTVDAADAPRATPMPAAVVGAHLRPVAKGGPCTICLVHCDDGVLCSTCQKR